MTIDITVYFDLKEEPMDGFGGVFLSPEEEKELSKLPPIRLGFGTRSPRSVKRVALAYPEKARSAGIQGTVLLELETDIRGRVKNIIVVRSIPELNDAATDAARQWIFEPFIIEGQPRRVAFMMPHTFSLGNRPKR
jgi:TonB family protein